MRKRNRYSALILAFVFVCICAFPVSAKQEDLKLYAQSAVLMDGSSGRILYGKGEDILRPMASTTKIMTCILVLESHRLEEEAEVSGNAASQPQVRLGVKKGERYRVEDLLYALMLESYNDAAVILAEHIGGSVKGFARMMNEKARELGCDQTYFITPNGLDAKEVDETGVERIHSTTAKELARIMKYCVMESPEKETFLTITRTQSYTFTDAEKKRTFSCQNHNAFLNMMEGALSGKTGFTGGAGYSYVGALKQGERVYIIALLGCGWPPHKTWKWADARTLYTYGLKHYQLKQVGYEGRFPDIPVEGGIYWKENGESVSITSGHTKEEMRVPILLKEGEKVTVVKKIPKALSAPVKKGQQAGQLEYRLNGKTLCVFPLYAERTVEKLTFSEAISYMEELFFSF